MSVALRQPMTVDAFLAWEARQEVRHEFDGFEPLAMNGGTVAHDRITFNLQRSLDEKLAGKPCRPLGPNVKIVVDGRVRYPDALVICQPLSPSATVAENPVVVFEVLSEGSSETDLIEKNREYRATDSIQRYVVLQQTHKAAIVFLLQAGGWLSEIMSGDSAVLDLPEIGIAVPLAEIYRDAGLE